MIGSLTRMLTGLMIYSAVLAAHGCAEESDSASYNSVIDSKQLMNWIVDPNADLIWASAGTISTLEGVQDLAPTTQEGWDAVRNSAATLAEAGNLLMAPYHSREGDWNEIALGLTNTAALLIEAAENKNDQQIFDYGGQLYNVCVACHQIYLYPEEV